MEREEIEPGVDRAIDEMDSGHREMKERSGELSNREDAARNEWHARQADSQVPGAVSPEEETGDDDAEEESAGDEESDDDDAEEESAGDEESDDDDAEEESAGDEESDAS